MIPLGSIVYPRAGGIAMIVVDAFPRSFIGAWKDAGGKIYEKQFRNVEVKIAKLPSLPVT